MRLGPDVLRDRRVRLPLIAALAIGAYLLFRQLVPDIDLEKLLQDISDALGEWTYVLVGLFAFLETGAFVGLVAPGETVVILAGAVAGQGATDVYVTIAIVWACAWAGDTVSFLIGQHLGRDFIIRHGRRVRITEERFKQVESYFSRHGGKTILIGRFVGLVRALAPFIAGSSGMRYRAFVPFSILGTGLWSAAFTLIGYFASRSIEQAAQAAEQGTLLLAIVIGTIVAIVVTVRFLRKPENRARIVEAMERRPALRPLLIAGRWVQPQARFLWQRVTPGGLGLELTTLLAVLSVSLYVLIAYTAILSGDPGPTGADLTAFDVVREIRGAVLTDLAKVLEDVGSAAVVLSLAAVTAAALALGRRWNELGVLLCAMAIIVIGTAELKHFVDRPRPVGGLTDVSGSSFPSGHASYSVFYAWLAVTLIVRLRPGLTGGTAIVVAGIALTVAAGLARVYLGVHYLSDVTAGWALGVSAFAGCATVALVISHLRQNERRGVRPRPSEDRA
jgi:membrane protein DedA with SNARE-associated domain/membrane-associated phospholipid phosphatase